MILPSSARIGHLQFFGNGKLDTRAEFFANPHNSNNPNNTQSRRTFFFSQIAFEVCANETDCNTLSSHIMSVYSIAKIVSTLSSYSIPKRFYLSMAHLCCTVLLLLFDGTERPNVPLNLDGICFVTACFVYRFTITTTNNSYQNRDKMNQIIVYVCVFVYLYVNACDSAKEYSILIILFGSLNLRRIKLSGVWTYMCICALVCVCVSAFCFIHFSCFHSNIY